MRHTERATQPGSTARATEPGSTERATERESTERATERGSTERATERESARSAAASRRIVAHAFVTLDGVLVEPVEWRHHTGNDEPADEPAPAPSPHGTAPAPNPYRNVPDTDRYRNPPGPDPHGDVVAARDITAATDGEALALGADVMSELAALKRQPGRDIVVTGGDTAIRELLQAGLVDDLHLRVHPLVAGGGQRLFPVTGARIPLTLVAASASSSGVLHLRYRPD